MIKNIFWFMRVSLYSIVLSVLGSNNFLIPTDKDALRAMQQPMPLKETNRQPTSKKRGTTQIYPQTVSRLKAEVSVQPDTLQKTRAVYQCRGNNGRTIFSDQPCGDIQRVTHLKHLQPNIADTFQRTTTNTAQSQTVNSTSQNSLRARNPANRQEINTRYDNLSRKIHHLLKDESGRLSHFLIQLNEDRREALSMYASNSDSYTINQHFDNLTRSIRRQENRRNKARVARQLLDLERQRNRKLYDDR